MSKKIAFDTVVHDNLADHVVWEANMWWPVGTIPTAHGIVAVTIYMPDTFDSGNVTAGHTAFTFVRSGKVYKRHHALPLPIYRAEAQAREFAAEMVATDPPIGNLPGSDPQIKTWIHSVERWRPDCESRDWGVFRANVFTEHGLVTISFAPPTAGPEIPPCTMSVVVGGRLFVCKFSTSFTVEKAAKVARSFAGDVAA
jgi:hypothetical protein